MEGEENVVIDDDNPNDDTERTRGNVAIVNARMIMMFLVKVFAYFGNKSLTGF